MPKRRVCILSLAPVEHDARVLRQVDCASRHHDVTVVAMGRLDHERDGVDMRAFDRHVFPARSRLVQTALLGVGRVRSSSFERWYWRKPDHRTALRHVEESGADLIHANEDMALPIAMRASETLGAPVLFDAHEYSLDQWGQGRLLRTLAGPLHRHLVTKYAPHSDAMVTVGPAIAKLYAQALGIKCSVITNAPPFAATPFSPTAAASLRIVHHGAAIGGRGIDSLIRSMALLPDRFSLHLMLMPGSPGSIEALRDLAVRVAPGRIVFVDPVPTNRVIESIAEFDIGAHLLPPACLNHDLAMPNKLFDFMMAGLAVAVGPSTAMAGVVREEGCGVVADGFDPEDLASALNALDADDVDRMKRSSLRAARTFNAEAEAEKLCELYGRLLVRPGSVGSSAKDPA